MEKWKWISLILCAYGFFKEFRPSEPFVTEYLIEYKNFTKSTVVHVAYPIATYSYLATLPIVFLITDYLRYKAIIVLEAVAFVLTYTLLIWGHGLTTLKVVEVLYGLACSTEVAYYTYIYAKVHRDQYKKVTSYTYTAILIGNFVAAIFSQAFVSAKWMNYHELHYLTLVSLTAALAISVFLPGVEKSIYFYRNINSELTSNIDTGDDKATRNHAEEDTTYGQRISRAYATLWSDFRNSYSNPHIIKWSVWWAIASAGFVQVVNYVQPLYETIYSYKTGEIYNAGVDAVHTILSAVMALAVGHVSWPWNKWGESLLLVTSLLQGLLLILMSQTGSIVAAYVCYIAFRTLYQVMITVASSEVAQGISDDSHGLIFGLNRFISLVLQSVLTFVLTDENGLSLDLRPQFLVYGIYFVVLGIVFGIACVITCRRRLHANQDGRNEISANSQ
ncbi:thiamine transporter 1 [Folsomia candida]|uniref:thiamine transporter 1 n=1 Tax=Folsomia candida TaxID=158441 RepID=UPI000B900BF7|nr:thiamine transporter 1 [Folsomia candida]